MHIKRLAVAALFTSIATGAAAQALPSGFQRTDPIVGRSAPSGVYFAHDGRVFVTEKSGRIWRYQNLLDTNPVLFADLRSEVHDFWDRGLLGFALDPRFPEVPRVYAQYAHNGGFGVPEAHWPQNNCPTPPGPTTNGGGCVISGRVSRFDVNGDAIGEEHVLVEDWYQQFPSHSVGTIAFGPDGYLYAGGGDGASFNGTDFGQWGNPDYPDPRSPMNQGGALRSQSLEIEDQYNAADHDVWLNGTISRIDAQSGDGAPGNPLAGDARPNAQRIVAYGLRNPFRFTFRPNSNGELWVGDVGYNTWEEINIVPTLANGDATLRNFGWPCFEGRSHTGGYGGASLAICNALYSAGNTGGRTPFAQPWYAYQHQGSSDITGLAFYEGDSYPAQYRDSLFFADNSRTIVFNIPHADADDDGMPDAPADGAATAFYGGSNATAVQLASGPGGDIFLANINTGKISRLSYCDGCGNIAPSAAIALDAGSAGDGAPRTIDFTASNSIDPNGDALSYAWDLDGDGTFGDALGVTASAFFGADGSHTVAVRASDGNGGVDVARMIVTVTNHAPTVAIAGPSPDLLWSAGETIALDASSSDAEQGSLPDDALAWTIYREDCANEDFTDCTESVLATAIGASSSFATPDAAFPMYLRIVLDGTDDGGLSDEDEIALYPATADLTLATDPAGLSIGFGDDPAPAPRTRTVIVDASVDVVAPLEQVVGTTQYVFQSWSDGGEAEHVVHVPAAGAATLTATFARPADIAVSLDDGVTEVSPGQAVTWSLHVANRGPNALAGLPIVADLPPTLTGVTWTCSGSAGAACAPGGSGALDTTADIEVGGFVDYAIHATVDASASGSVTIAASAVVPSDFLNTTPADDSASDTDVIFADVIFEDGFDAGE